MKKTYQKGAALIIFALVIVLVATTFLVSKLDAYSIDVERNKKTTAALAEAKAALIGSVAGVPNIAIPAHLPNPDLKLSALIPEGNQAGMAGAVDLSLLGKFPWRSLGVLPLKDGWNECLWYVVSGRFKNSPPTNALNWDTQGQITVIDNNANVLGTKLAALIVSPSTTLIGQDRQLVAIDTPQCGGNYDARNYLDTFNAINAVAGALNYFAGSPNNRQALNTNDKTFVLTKNDFYNDHFIFITVDEIFNPLIRRSDFKARIDSLLDDSDFRLQAETGHFETVVIAGTKGVDNINCNLIVNIDNQTFCNNWKEMLLLTELSPAAPITIDGIASAASCSRVLIFGGQKVGAQSRITAVDKSLVANYLEGINLAEFNTPIANGSNFSGVSIFNSSNSSADILKCI